MKKTIAALIAALFIFYSPATALAPSQPKEIETFGPVILDTDFYGAFKSPDVEAFREIVILPTPEIIILTSTPTVWEAKQYALAKLGTKQYSCIDKIFTQESHWNPLAKNKSSGAYGIPQALPGSKMAVMGDDWRTNPITQVKWGIRYVNVRYGSACKAWEFKKVHGWY